MPVHSKRDGAQRGFPVLRKRRWDLCLARGGDARPARGDQAGEMSCARGPSPRRLTVLTMQIRGVSHLASKIAPSGLISTYALS